MIKNKNKKEEEEQTSQLSNRINKGTKLKGDIEAQGNFRIDGAIEGDINCKTKLVLGETSSITGNVVAQTIEVSGSLKGNIKATEMLILKSTAQVVGDISAEQMVVEVGARFNGTSEMGSVVRDNNPLQSKK
ncbi:MAG: polymer-forming cytoskeletal protein [Cyclobacteriaceae bacterium]